MAAATIEDVTLGLGQQSLVVGNTRGIQVMQNASKRWSVQSHYSPTASEQKRTRQAPHLDNAYNGNTNGVQMIDKECKYSGAQLQVTSTIVHKCGPLPATLPLTPTAYFNEHAYARCGPVVLDFRAAGIVRSTHPPSSIPTCDKAGGQELTRTIQKLENVPHVTGYMPRRGKMQQGLASTATTSRGCNPMSRNDAHAAVTLPMGAEPFATRTNTHNIRRRMLHLHTGSEISLRSQSQRQFQIGNIQVARHIVSHVYALSKKQCLISKDILQPTKAPILEVHQKLLHKELESHICQ